ncbi:MAG: PadR family transcriptional regulator [Clostridia bacterium]|nr:PadR family transcriptional regulator [Clostridia bacterium]
MNKYPALTETVFYILLSLSNPLHGYAIMQNIKALTNGRINMGAGTLYGALSALTEKEYITEVRSDDPSKRLYIRTELGTEIIENEIKRLNELTQNAGLYFKREEM